MEPIFFWKPEQEHGFLSQWHKSSFTDYERKVVFTTAEQYMMYEKAVLFAPDSEFPMKILRENDPKTIRALGRKLPNFDSDKWNENRYKIVVNGRYLKFTQDESLTEKLLETGDRELVEASPLDRIWGVGYGKNNATSMRHKWGLNLLGKALMEVRSRIREEQ